jgi:hypothetical protein
MLQDFSRACDRVAEFGLAGPVVLRRTTGAAQIARDVDATDAGASTTISA